MIVCMVQPHNRCCFLFAPRHMAGMASPNTAARAAAAVVVKNVGDLTGEHVVIRSPPRESAPEDELSPIDTYDAALIKAHLASLRAEAFVRRFRPLVVRLMEHPVNGGIFNVPVDPVALKIPDYTTVITHPMDLGTVRSRLESGQHYRTATQLGNDLRLVFANAMKYNPPKHPVHRAAERLADECETQFRRLSLKSQVRVQRRVSRLRAGCSSAAHFVPPPPYSRATLHGSRLITAASAKARCACCVATSASSLTLPTSSATTAATKSSEAATTTAPQQASDGAHAACPLGLASLAARLPRASRLPCSSAPPLSHQLVLGLELELGQGQEQELVPRATCW